MPLLFIIIIFGFHTQIKFYHLFKGYIHNGQVEHLRHYKKEATLFQRYLLTI